VYFRKLKTKGMVILNNHLITCIESTSSSNWLCNTNEKAETDMVRVLGVRVEEDGRRLICYIPVGYGAGVINNLAISTKITFLTAIIFTYESYQVKGRYISQRNCTEDEMAYLTAYVEGFTIAMARQGLSKEKGFKAFFQQPCIALQLLAEEVYDQTPKKGTGNKLTV
jgi:hypothetical protein